MKRLIASMLIVFLISVAFIGSFYKGYYCYATNQDGTLTNDELDIALSSWLQSHGGNLFSPQNYRARKTYEAGLLHNFIYGDGGGYDSIRQHINGGIGGNNELRFDFDGFIIQKLNTWLNNKLQSGEFGSNVSLGDDGMLVNGNDTDNNLYNGYSVNADGNTYLVYITNGNMSNNSVSKQGTPIFKDVDTLIAFRGNETLSINIFGTNYQNNFKYYTNPNNSSIKYVDNVATDGSTSHTYHLIDFLNENVRGISNMGIAYNTSTGKLYYGQYCKTTGLSYLPNTNFFYTTTAFVITPPASGSEYENDFNTANIFFNVNNNLNVTNYPDIQADGKLYLTPKIKVNGEYKPYIVNQGDTINNVINNYYQDSNNPDDTATQPSDQPSDSGGGSGGSGGTLPNWSNPYPNLSPDGSGGFNFNFTLPDLNIDWNINGLSEKFPFSIPFDLIRFITVLNAEPETPHFEGTVNLIVYQWDIDADLSQFDNLASIVRNVEFIGFCITLILITRKMIKG